MSNAGFEYDVQNTSMTHSDAEQFCVARNGHLTSILSEEESEFLKDFASRTYNCGGRLEIDIGSA